MIVKFHRRASARAASRTLGIAVVLIALAGPGLAAADLSDEDRADISRIEALLNDMQTLRARFFQIGPDGVSVEGSLYLKRPGRVRIEYDPPSPLLIVGNGSQLYFLDRELGQVNNWPVFDTPLGVLVRKEIDLSEDVEITGVERRPGVISLTFVDPDDPEEGNLTLIFTEPPLALRQWKVKDAQGLVTIVALTEMEVNRSIDEMLFVFDDPRLPLPPGLR